MSQKPRLSKSILEMKFMKRTKEKVEKENDDAEGRAMYANEITERMIHGSNFIIEPSYIHCEKLINGRLSFRGMNPDIEKIMEKQEAEKRALTEEQEQIEKAKMQTDVNDDEMMEYYGNVVQTMKNKFEKFNKKRRADLATSSKVGTKKKFLKPKTDD